MTPVQYMCVYLNEKTEHLPIWYLGKQSPGGDGGSGMETDFSWWTDVVSFFSKVAFDFQTLPIG